MRDICYYNVQFSEAVCIATAWKGGVTSGGTLYNLQVANELGRTDTWARSCEKKNTCRASLEEHATLCNTERSYYNYYCFRKVELNSILCRHNDFGHWKVCYPVQCLQLGCRCIARQNAHNHYKKVIHSLGWKVKVRRPVWTLASEVLQSRFHPKICGQSKFTPVDLYNTPWWL